MGLTIESLIRFPGDGKGKLLAWDPVAQKLRWSVQHDQLWNGGTLATAGDVVFQGAADGWFSAYDGRNGNQLWRFNAGLGIVSAPMQLQREWQTICLGAGWAMAAQPPALGKIMNLGWKYGAQPRRLLTFVLDGKAKLPPTAPPDMQVHAVDDPALVAR